MYRRLARRMPATLAAATAAATLAVSAAAGALPSANPADGLLDRGIDPLRYDPAERCTKGARSGTLALQAWLERNSAGSSWGIVRCERWGKRSASVHAEGRAIDWHLDAAVPSQRRAADRLVRLLLAPDRAGNPVALARRMGVQGIIWNCRAWFGSPDGRMGPYSACFTRRGGRRRVDRTTAHRDHVHIELNRLGAARRTTFWNPRVRWAAEPDSGGSSGHREGAR